MKRFVAAVDTFRRLDVTSFALMMLLAAGVDVARAAPPWGIACGDGRVDTIIDDFEAIDDIDDPWTFCCTADLTILPPPKIPRQVTGCRDSAMAIDYDLTKIAPPGSPNEGQSWIVVQKSLPAARDLTGYTHIRVALKGSNGNSHETVELKLNDGTGLFTARLASITDLPTWRAIYVDLREFKGAPNANINLANIVGLEIGIKRCPSPSDHEAIKDCESIDDPPGVPSEDHGGTLFVDELAAVDLRPGTPNRLGQVASERVTPDPAVRAGAASALLAAVTPSGPGVGLVPAWFPEAARGAPNFDTYAQAEALLVFVYEYERTGDVADRQAARNLATRLIGPDMQIPTGHAHAGAWYSSYHIGIDPIDPMTLTLRPPGRQLPPGQPCDGDEPMVQDPNDPEHTWVATNLDACEWIGNVGWALIALSRLLRSGIYGDPAALQAAVDAGAAWLANQSTFRRNTPPPAPNRLHDFPDLIALGIEGNISAYFGLLAAGRTDDAAQLGAAILQNNAGWDPVQRRLKTGVDDVATAIDVGGSWGVRFLRSMGRIQDARDSRSYAASILRIGSFDDSVFGYGDIAGPFTPTVEFGAQAAAAGIKDANFVMQQIYPLRQRCDDNQGHGYPGAFPGAADHWYGGTLPPWNTTMCGVSPTAWVYFACSVDPLKELTATFGDVPRTHALWSWVEALVDAAVTSGCATDPSGYCPDAAVTRGQMAVFLLRGEHGSDYVPPTPQTPTFADVPLDHPFAAWIDQLAAEGITGGCGTGPARYCPDQPVTRGQMAVFLLRGEHGGDYVPPAPQTPTFADVPLDHPFAAWIYQLAAEGITGGCGTGPARYCPDQPVTRGQMAVFLVRTFHLL